MILPVVIRPIAAILLAAALTPEARAQDGRELSPAEQAVQDLHRERAADLERVDELTERAKAGLSDYSLGDGVDPRQDGRVPADHERTESEWSLDEEDDDASWAPWLLGGVIVVGTGYLGLRWWRGDE